ncbi:MAG: hypothetical protein PHO41_01005 [Eubacteriales bacterium]|nr:hypothetical protein [Eubacteriales bacterium]
MKRVLAIALVLVLALTFTACGGNKAAIVGAWELADTETEATYGFGLEFKKDGTMLYGITSELMSQMGGSDMSEEELEEAMEGMGMMMDIKYKIHNDTEMEVTVSAFFGLASEKTTVPYKLDGDTLEFDGATYKRVK